ncbi:MAG: glycosyltransferase family 2 protein, partial [Jiangellaceae bacterium]
IAAGFRALAGEGAPDAVGGRVEVFHEDEGAGPSTGPRTVPRTGAQAFEAVFAFENRAYVERKGFSVTANLVTRRAVFEDVGPFRPGLSEDLDWCARARARGCCGAASS